MDPLVRRARGGRHARDVLLYQASSPEKIREHAARAGIPATDIYPVAETVLVRPDPVAVVV